MDSYSFDVEDTPRPQPRSRMARLPNGGIRNYDAGTSNDWKAAIAVEAKKVRPAAPLRGPLRMVAVFRFRRPKSHYRKNGELKPAQPYHVCSKGKNDADNLFKAPADVLTRIGFWEDDGQIAVAQITKRYVVGLERPGAFFLINTLDDECAP